MPGCTLEHVRPEEGFAGLGTSKRLAPLYDRRMQHRSIVHSSKAGPLQSLSERELALRGIVRGTRSAASFRVAPCPVKCAILRLSEDYPLRGGSDEPHCRFTSGKSRIREGPCRAGSEASRECPSARA